MVIHECGVKMHFNHLVPREEFFKNCEQEKHYFIPTRHVEASLGHVAVRFKCKHCKRLATSFLTNEEYAIHGKLIESYGA